jgi:hypothetical protein
MLDVNQAPLQVKVLQTIRADVVKAPEVLDKDLVRDLEQKDIGQSLPSSAVLEFILTPEAHL